MKYGRNVSPTAVALIKKKKHQQKSDGLLTYFLK